MQKKYKLTLSDIETFIDNCSEAASEAYEPYIDFDRKPDIISSRLQPALLHNSGIELFEDADVPALYLVNSAHSLSAAALHSHIMIMTAHSRMSCPCSSPLNTDAMVWGACL